MSSENKSPHSFDPAGFSSIYAVQEWSPGDQVRFVRPLRIGRVAFTAPIVIAGYLSGPVWFAVHRGSVDPQLLEAVVIGFIGVAIGTFVAVETALSTPRAVIFDWTTRTFRVAGWYERLAVAFEDLTAVRLTYLKNFGVRGSRQGDLHNCEVYVDAKTSKGPKSVLVVETEAFSDPETPRRMALPLATALAAGLRLPPPLIQSR